MTDTSCLVLDAVLTACSVLDVDGQNNEHGPSTQTVANPCPGSGNTLVFIAVAPGPGFDVGGETWVSPAGGVQLDDYVDGAGSFVQRYRVWTAPDTGIASYTFGYQTANPTVSFTNQTCIIVCLSDVATSALSGGPPNIDVTTNTAFSTIQTFADQLLLAVATSQNDDVVLSRPNDPPQWDQIMNNTGGPGDRRGVALFANNAVANATTPGPVDWSAGTAAHVNFVLKFACADAPVSTCQKIDPSRARIYNTPDPATDWGPGRGDGQILGGGDRINAGQTCGNINGTLPACWVGNELYGGFAMENGDARVLYPGVSADGVASIIGAMQYVKDGSYLPPGAGGVHGTVNSPPSHQLFADGTRIEVGYIGTPVGVGPTQGEEFWFTTSIVKKPWMNANDSTTALFEVHVPVGIAGTSPLLFSIRSGQLTAFSRYSAAPIGNVANTNSVTSGVTLANVALPTNNEERMGVHIKAKIDPTGSGYFQMWVSYGIGGACQQVADFGPNFGMYFANDALNSQLYPQQLKLYNFHQFVNSGQATENWDDTVTANNRRDLESAYSILYDDPTITIAEICENDYAFVGGNC